MFTVLDSARRGVGEGRKYKIINANKKIKPQWVLNNDLFMLMLQINLINPGMLDRNVSIWDSFHRIVTDIRVLQIDVLCQSTKGCKIGMKQRTKALQLKLQQLLY